MMTHTAHPCLPKSWLPNRRFAVSDLKTWFSKPASLLDFLALLCFLLTGPHLSCALLKLHHSPLLISCCFSLLYCVAQCNLEERPKLCFFFFGKDLFKRQLSFRPGYKLWPWDVSVHLLSLAQPFVWAPFVCFVSCLGGPLLSLEPEHLCRAELIRVWRDAAAAILNNVF